MVQVSPAATLIDLTLRGVSPGTYRATIRASGDLSAGASSTGPVWSGTDMGGAALDEAGEPRGVLATFEVGTDGRAAVFLDKGLQVWEVIGRGMVVTRQEEKVCRGGSVWQDDEDTVVGGIARSAGMWDNDKTVCSCTGKTLWEERKDEVKKGMM